MPSPNISFTGPDPIRLTCNGNNSVTVQVIPRIVGNVDVILSIDNHPDCSLNGGQSIEQSFQSNNANNPQNVTFNFNVSCNPPGNYQTTLTAEARNDDGSSSDFRDADIECQ